jgi:hypothetical protein
MKMKVKEIAKKVKRRGGELQALITHPHSRDYSRTTVKCEHYWPDWLWVDVQCEAVRLSPETMLEINPDGSFLLPNRGILITIIYPMLGYKK